MVGVVEGCRAHPGAFLGDLDPPASTGLYLNAPPAPQKSLFPLQPSTEPCARVVRASGPTPSLSSWKVSPWQAIHLRTHWLSFLSSLPHQSAVAGGSHLPAQTPGSETKLFLVCAEFFGFSFIHLFFHLLVC